jgi:hypothetical protein
MADGLTRTQAEADLSGRIATEVVVVGAQRRTVAEAGGSCVDHLEHVMQRKRTTLQDYRGYLRRHLAPFFGGRPSDKINRTQVTATSSLPTRSLRTFSTRRSSESGSALRSRAPASRTCLPRASPTFGPR